MKKYKMLITSSLLTALITLSPVVSLADNNSKDKEDNENKNKIEQVSEIGKGKEIREEKEVKENKEDKKEEREDKDKKVNSWFGSNWFNSNNTKITTAPVISNVLVTSTKSNKATIKWETDVRANTFVWYSKTSPVDTSVNPIMKRGNRVLKHKIELKRLEAGTKYYVVVGSANNIGTIKSAEMSFTTQPKVINDVPVVIDTVAPVISNIETTVSGSSVVVSWKTDEATSSTIFYSNTTPVDTTEANLMKVVNNNLTKEHSLSIPNLTSNTLYHFKLKSVDASNNTVSSSELSFRTN